MVGHCILVVTASLPAEQCISVLPLVETLQAHFSDFSTSPFPVYGTYSCLATHTRLSLSTDLHILLPVTFSSFFPWTIATRNDTCSDNQV